MDFEHNDNKFNLMSKNKWATCLYPKKITQIMEMNKVIFDLQFKKCIRISFFITKLQIKNINVESFS